MGDGPLKLVLFFLIVLGMKMDLSEMKTSSFFAGASQANARSSDHKLSMKSMQLNNIYIYILATLKEKNMGNVCLRKTAVLD